MWSAPGRRQVISGKSFRCYEKSVGSLDRDETREEARCELTVTVAHDPHFSERGIERAHDRVSRRPRYAQMSLLEFAKTSIGRWNAID